MSFVNMGRRICTRLISLQETRRDNQSLFKQLDTRCIAVERAETKAVKKGPCGVGLAMIEKIVRAVVGPPEYINEPARKVTLNLRARASGGTFLVPCGQPNLPVARAKNMLSGQHLRGL